MELHARIQSSLDSIRPALHTDGGDIELVSVDVEQGIVQVRLMGACGACPISMMTMKYGVEKRVKEAAPEIREVVAV
jgi:Fe-S cluster biogenesis protein NfuA